MRFFLKLTNTNHIDKMTMTTTQNERAGIIRAINTNKAKHIGTLETEDGVLELMTLGKLVFSGSPTNACFLVDWDRIAFFESWEDPAQAYCEEFEV